MNLEKENDRKGLVATIFIHIIIVLLLLILLMPIKAKDKIEPPKVVMIDMGSSGERGGSSANDPQESESTSAPAQNNPIDNPNPTQTNEPPVITSPQNNAPPLPTPPTNDSKVDDKTPKPTLDPRIAEMMRKAEVARKKREADEAAKKAAGAGGGDNDDNGPGKGLGDDNGKDKSGNFSSNISGFGIGSVPSFSNEKQVFGSIVVHVCLDKNGRIKPESVAFYSGTTANTYLKDLTIENVKKMTFKSLGDIRSDHNCGTVTVNYKPE
ncbi:MAG: hypothetical protein ACI8ZN_001332 [Bacteroidia bacterium]|jgi:hypothetical protein